MSQVQSQDSEDPQHLQPDVLHQVRNSFRQQNRRSGTYELDSQPTCSGGDAKEGERIGVGCGRHVIILVILMTGIRRIASMRAMSEHFYDLGISLE